MTDVSIVVPIYNEEESLPHLLKKVAETMRKTDKSWEIICVDDGSKDTSAEVMQKLTADYPEFVPVYQNRNHGQTAAMQAGFDRAQGDVIITMDGDLQNDPADIPMMLEKMAEEKADIVSGWRKNRKDDGWRNFLSRVANKHFVCRMTEVNLHDTGCSLKAYKREVLERVNIYGELHRFIPAVTSQFGAKVVEVEVTHHAREFGVSKYGNMGRAIRVLLDLTLLKFMLKFITRPIHAFGTAGFIFMGLGGLGLMIAFLRALFGTEASLTALTVVGFGSIFTGALLIGMGILAEMLSRIYHEPEGRKQSYQKEVK